MSMTYYKIFKELAYGCAESPYGHQVYEIPGEYPKLEGGAVLCKWGYHFCTPAQLLRYLYQAQTICEVIPHGEVLIDDEKCCTVGPIEILEPLNWNERIARLFAADCAEHVLRRFEKACPNDDRPRKAIEAARKFANGEISVSALERASDAAYNAANAAYAAAYNAAYNAAYAAAYAAADAAYCAADAAYNAAYYAANAANAAYNAAYAAAYAAANAAGHVFSNTARQVEKQWQARRIIQYLRGNVAREEEG